MATSAQDEYYRKMKKNLIKANIVSDGEICNEKIHQAVIDLRAELDLEHERNMNNITNEDFYISPIEKKETKTINDSVNFVSDEHTDTISDLSKQVDASNKLITVTYIVEGVNNLSVGIVSAEPAVIRVGIIARGITECVISGRTSIVKNIVTDISSDSSKQLFKTNTFHLNLLQFETLVIGSQDESMKIRNMIMSTPSDGRNIKGNRIIRIDTPGANKNVWVVINTNSNVLSDTYNVK